MTMKQLMSLQEMIEERKTNMEPGAKDITTYDPDDIEDYYDIHYKSLRIYGANLVAASPLAAAQSKATGPATGTTGGPTGGLT